MLTHLKFMKKHILSLIVFLILITSCQKDDFCIDETTPQLIIRFYDNDEPTEYKSATGLYVWANELDTIYNNVSTDSIAIPLNPSLDLTVYHLSSKTIEDELTINYSRKEVYVSRSCGFKYNFENINLSGITNNWILNTEVTNQTVENETEHVKIFH